MLVLRRDPCKVVLLCMQVPCLVMQPYQIPYTLPGSFARRFARACPGLAAALQRAADLSSDSDRVSWKDVRGEGACMQRGLQHITDACINTHL